MLLVLRRGPYGNALARASLDVALAAAAFEQDVHLLFMDDGVWQLLPGQQPADIAAKNLHKTCSLCPCMTLSPFTWKPSHCSSGS